MKKLFILALAILGLSSAYASFTMSPHFVVLTADKKTNSVRILNSGTKIQNYIVAFTEFKQNKDGSYSNVEKTDTTLMLASPYMLIGKKSISVNPKSSELIRIEAKFDKLQDGEYRSHLFVQEQTPPDIKGSDKKLENGKFAFDISANYGITIPVIIRKGNLDVSLAIVSATITEKNEQKGLLVAFERSGNRSVRGNIEVLDGKKQVSMLNDVAFYTDLTSREVLLPVEADKIGALKGKKLKVVFTVSKSDKAKFEKVEKELVIN